MFLEFTLILVALIFLIDAAIRNYTNRNLKNVPLVSTIPIVGSILTALTIKPENFYIKWPEFIKRFGKTFCGKALGRLIVVTVDHRIVDTILTSHEHLEKHVLYYLLSPWLGSGLLLSTGKTWSTMRKIITPTFHFKILEQFLVVIDRQADIFIEKLKSKANGSITLNIEKPMSLLTLDIIAETAMGVSINAQMDSESQFVTSVHDLTDIMGVRFIRPYLSLPMLYPFMAPKMYQKEKKGIKLVHAFTEKIITEKQLALANNSQGVGRKELQNDPLELGLKSRMALLDVLLQATVNGQPLADKQIRDEVNTFMFEGHDTTSAATSFCLYAISRHPRVQEKLFRELNEHFGNDLHHPLNFNDLQNVTYLNCVIKESLRMYPPILAVGRRLSSDLKVDDICIPAHSSIIILLWELLRDPEIFDDPLTFLPERHLENNIQVNAFSNIPFSAGPRNCIGQKFALLEMRAIVVKVVRNFELLPLGEKVQPSMRIILRSHSGINLGLKTRVYN